MRYIRTPTLKRLFSFRRHEEEEGEENHPTNPHPEDDERHLHKPTWKCFSFDDLFTATDGFSPCNLVGKGGYADVYKGTLHDGRAIAVKRLTNAPHDERKEKEFLMEIGMLGHVSHPNVTSLLGCCVDNGLYLVFHLSSRGSLASLLHDENVPTMEWGLRYKIGVGAARGLHYLHNNCPRRIIHRDIKASNILLAADFEPQISDFGLAKWLPSQWSHRSIGSIEGTFGHLAPEYFMHGVVDEKTDVFAFGVLLLELLSGKKPVDNLHQSLHSWAKPILIRGNLREVIDPRLGENYNVIQLNRLAFSASLCIRSSPIWRPTMAEVLALMTMDGEIDIERWKMPDDGDDDDDQFLGFEDLDCESDDDEDEDNSYNSLLDSPQVGSASITGSRCKENVISTLDHGPINV